MNKFIKLFFTVLIFGIILTGCATLSIDKIKSISLVVQQTSKQATSYAIKKDPSSVVYFKLASTSIDHFILGNDLSPTAFQNSLLQIPGMTNSYVNLAIDAVIITYDIAYSQYVIERINSQTNAVILLNAINNGFKLALNETNIVTFKISKESPDFIKNNKIDKELLRLRITTAGK